MSFQLYSLSTCVYRCSGMDTPHTTCILDPAARGLWYPIGISGHWAVCREKTDFQISKIDWVGHLCAWHHVWQELHPEKDERRSPHQVLHGHQWASRIFVSRISRISFHNNYADIVFLFWPQFPLAIKSYSPPKFERYWTEPCSVRLCIITILRGRFGDLICMMGILCSTWTVVNTGTSCRDLLTPMGQQDYPSVASGNQMVSRTSPPKKGYSQTCLKHTYIYIISNICVISLYIYRVIYN